MPRASSTEFVPEVASCLMDRRAMEPSRETVSISSCPDEEEDKDVAASCEDIQSSLTPEDCTWITRQFGLEVLVPYELERLHTPLDGYVTFSELYLKFGVQFPLHPFFVEVLQYFGLTVFQITPNGWAHMIRFFILLMEQGIGPPTTIDFAWFYSVKGSNNDEGFYYFAKRSAKGL